MRILAVALLALAAMSARSSAEPSHKLSIQVPTRLAITRTDDALKVAVDPKAHEETTITVDGDLITGVKSELRIHLADETSDKPGRTGLSSGVAFNLGEDFFDRKRDGLPVPGKHYVVEMTLDVFETDVPPQHMWSPQGPRYKVLWSRTLTQAVK